MATRYVALDLETTGLDPQNDAVMEAGAVRFDAGGVLDTFVSFVNPRRPIPHGIQALTGITDGDVAGAPPMEEVARRLQAFIGDDILVGQNILGFDITFVERAGILHNAAIYDTQALASLLLPGLPEYGLAALTEYFEIDFPVRHRALPDAEATRRVFLALFERARGLPLDVLSNVASWLTPTPFPWRGFFGRAWEAAAAANGAARPFRLSAAKVPAPLSPQRIVTPVPPERPLEILASARERPDVLPDFDEREEQKRMTTAVAETLNAAQVEGRPGRLLVEAGTGTGKSLAYLIPAACQATANGLRVVVSTATINLQEQLTKKDLPIVQSLCGEGTVRACQMKGRRNYLCLRQYEALRQQQLMTDEEALLASRILIWLCTTETGDRAELRMTPEEERIWPKLSADNLGCNPETSPYVVDGTCFYQRARKTAEASHIVVVNHSLLLSDIATGGYVLPQYDHLIIDEAHHLEDEATKQFGFTAGERQLSEMLERCEAVPKSVQAVLKTPRAALAPYDEIGAALGGMHSAASTARTRLAELSRASLAFLAQHAGEPAEGEQRLHVTRAMRVQPDWPDIEMAWENLKLPLREVVGGLEKTLSLLTRPDGFPAVNQELVVADIAGLSGDLQATLTGLEAAIPQDDPDRIIWLERDRSDGGIVFSWVPLVVRELLRGQLYEGRASVVLTGATLQSSPPPVSGWKPDLLENSRGGSSSRGGFTYMQERLGLEEAETLALGSPFDFRRAALVLLPRDMPEPVHADYAKALGQAIIDLARASQGRALVLFTSHSSLRGTYAIVEEPLRREGINVLGQGIDGSPRQLVRALQATPNSVVLGTSSFWEGVDIAGEALSLLVIARLPFAVPSDPVFAARSALYEDPFGQYAVPQAVLRFKQGFGRLIRTKTDRGVLAVLDSRILSRTYGPAFTQALPPCTFRPALLREMPDLVERWLTSPIAATEVRDKSILSRPSS